MDLQLRELAYEFNSLQQQVKLVKSDASAETHSLQFEVRNLQTQLFKQQILSRTSNSSNLRKSNYVPQPKPCRSVSLPPISKSQDRKTFDSPASFYKTPIPRMPKKYFSTSPKKYSETREEKKTDSPVKNSSFHLREMTFLKESFWGDSQHSDHRPLFQSSSDSFLKESALQTNFRYGDPAQLPAKFQKQVPHTQEDASLSITIPERFDDVSEDTLKALDSVNQDSFLASFQKPFRNLKFQELDGMNYSLSSQDVSFPLK